MNSNGWELRKTTGVLTTIILHKKGISIIFIARRVSTTLEILTRVLTQKKSLLKIATLSNFAKHLQ